MTEHQVLRTILHSHDLKGFKIHNLNDGIVKTFEIPSNLIKKVSAIKDVNNSGIYFLINTKEQSLYIGQTDNLWSRLNEHNHSTSKSFERALLFTAQGNIWSRTYIDYLEWFYINKFFTSSYWSIQNKEKRKKEPNVSEYEIPSLKSIISTIDTIIFALGIDFHDDSLENKEDHIFYLKEAMLTYQDGKFFLLKNSVLPCISDEQIKEMTTFSNGELHVGGTYFQKKFYDQRIKFEELVDSGLAVKIGEHSIKLKKDIEVNSPSLASEYAKKTTASSGWIDWKNKKNQTLDDFYRNKK